VISYSREKIRTSQTGFLEGLFVSPFPNASMVAGEKSLRDFMSAEVRWLGVVWRVQQAMHE
jgi:hypothetical protein